MSVRPKMAFEAAQSFSLRTALAIQETESAGSSAVHIPPVQSALTFNLASIKRDDQTSAASAASAALATPVAELPQHIQQPLKGMNFKLNLGEKQQQSRTFVEQPTKMPTLTFSSMSGSNRPTPFAAQKAEMDLKEQANTRADVMRLTAYVDELTSRLKNTQTRLEKTEFQLTRTSQVLCKERQTADQTLDAYKQDLARSHETEEKLRAEITANKKKTALQETTFMSSVGVALASDEQLRMQQHNLDELETKVKALGEFKTTLETEVAKLTSLRDHAKKSLDEIKTSFALETTRVESISADVAVAQKELETTKAETATLLSRMADVKIEEATIKEGMDALKSGRIRAEDETAAAKSALQAMLLEHADVSRKLSSQQNKLAELESKEAVALESLLQVETKLSEASRSLPEPPEPALAPVPEEEAPEVPIFTLETQTQCCPRCAMQQGPESDLESDLESVPDSDDEPQLELRPPAPRLAPSRPGRVTGAVAPDNALGCNFDLPVPHPEGSCMAAVAVIDAPLGWASSIPFAGTGFASTGAASPTNPTNPQDAMIEAVVSDLKQKLVEISTLQPTSRRVVAPLV